MTCVVTTVPASVSGATVTYTVGAGGVSKGDLVKISANDTVIEYATITAAAWCPGIATTAAVQGAPVQIMKQGVLTGVLSGATAGAIYWWNGSAPTATQPSTTGQYVWRLGRAKNATDLDVQVEFYKLNA